MAREMALKGDRVLMLGCPTDAKWTTRIYGDQVMSHGAGIRLYHRVDRLVVDNGRCIGVAGRHPGRPFEYRSRSPSFTAAMHPLSHRPRAFPPYGPLLPWPTAWPDTSIDN